MDGKTAGKKKPTMNFRGVVADNNILALREKSYILHNKHVKITDD